jgi:hypothetical protein
MRRFVLAALLLLAGMAGAAATEPQKLAPGQSLHGHFDQQRYLKGFAKPLHSTGSFVLAGGIGLIWRGETPFQNVTVLSAAGILQSADGKETMHLAASRMPMLGRFYQVLNGALSGDADALTQDFKLARQGSGEGWQLILTPVRPDDPILGQIAAITVRGTRFVDSVDIEKAGGDHDELHFSDQIAGATALSPEEQSLFDGVAK